MERANLQKILQQKRYRCEVTVQLGSEGKTVTSGFVEKGDSVDEIFTRIKNRCKTKPSSITVQPI